MQSALVPATEDKPSVKIPPLLLEGDEPAPPATVSQPAANPIILSATELPETFGTAKLLLISRDPRCIYAHWDLTNEQQQNYAALSSKGHLALRLHYEHADGPSAAEVNIQSDSKYTFIDVAESGRSYVAELGYYEKSHVWKSIAFSNVVTTPCDKVSDDKTVQFAMVRPIRTKVPAGLSNSTVTPPLRPISPARMAWIPALGLEPKGAGLSSGMADPFGESVDSATTTICGIEWTPEQEHIFEELLRLEKLTPYSLSSLELTRGHSKKL